MTKTNKRLYLVTYIIALVFLVAGLVVPCYGDTLLISQLVEAFKALIGNSSNFNGSLVYALGSFELDVGALFALLYILVTVVGLFLLIPAILSKEGKATKACAYVIEIIATIVLLFVLINQVGYTAGGLDILGILAVVIALCGTFIILIIQTIADKKGSGVLKCVMALLGIISVFAILDLTVIGLSSEIGSLGGLFAQAADGSLVTGSYALKNVIETVCGNGSYVFGTGTAGAIASWCAALAVLLVIINAGIDLIHLGAKANRGTHIFDWARYLLEFLFALIAFILLFVAEGTAIGLLIIIVLAISFITTVVSILRTFLYRKPEAEAESTEEETEEEPEEETVEMVPEEPEEEPETYVSDGGVVVYKEREPYNGPEDSFISRLTESEKKEFAKIFLDKIYGPYENIPDYVVDGDNKDFFDSVFAYLGKFRPIVSDGLMKKLYSEKNLLN